MNDLGRALGVAADRYADMADDVRHKIRIVLWMGGESKAEWGPDCPGHTEWKHTLSQVDPVLVKRPFFLPYVAFRDFGDYCDVFGNLLAILFDVANPAHEKRILDYLRQVGIADPYPVRVLHPAIHPGNKDWREYYRNNNLNLPEQYHNGYDQYYKKGRLLYIHPSEATVLGCGVSFSATHDGRPLVEVDISS
jgi:hypothetical protein